MIRIADSLFQLGLTEYVMRGEPTNESEFNSMFKRVVDGVESSNPSDFGTTWTAVKAKYDELVAAEPMTLLRKERNRRIASTDWWASSDLTMTDAQKKYRQDLRDITKSATSLDDVTWPEKP